MKTPDKTTSQTESIELNRQNPLLILPWVRSWRIPCYIWSPLSYNYIGEFCIGPCMVDCGCSFLLLKISSADELEHLFQLFPSHKWQFRIGCGLGTAETCPTLIIKSNIQRNACHSWNIKRRYSSYSRRWINSCSLQSGIKFTFSFPSGSIKKMIFSATMDIDCFNILLPSSLLGCVLNLEQE